MPMNTKRYALVIEATSTGYCAFCPDVAGCAAVGDTPEETTIAVIVPISLWREIESERERRYLLRSETMRRRLLDAKNRDEGVTLEDAVQQLKL
jgi:antitoxin YefM